MGLPAVAAVAIAVNVFATRALNDADDCWWLGDGPVLGVAAAVDSGAGVFRAVLVRRGRSAAREGCGS